MLRPCWFIITGYVIADREILSYHSCKAGSDTGLYYALHLSFQSPNMLTNRCQLSSTTPPPWIPTNVIFVLIWNLFIFAEKGNEQSNINVPVLKHICLALFISTSIVKQVGFHTTARLQSVDDFA
jgi:hypothetical protein